MLRRRGMNDKQSTSTIVRGYNITFLPETLGLACDSSFGPAKSMRLLREPFTFTVCMDGEYYNTSSGLDSQSTYSYCLI